MQESEWKPHYERRVLGDWNAFGIGILAAVFLLFVVAATTPMTAMAQDATTNFVLHKAPRGLPRVQFRDADGRITSLADFRGKVVLLNIWATWCVPCRVEMPTLDRLQAELGGEKFEVLALSIDRAGLEKVRDFYDDIGLRHLSIYIDSSAKATRQLRAFGLPTTLLIDREGREIGRLIGPSEWDSPEMIDFIQSRL